MDGLECSEVMLSKLINDNIGFRIDSEYYKKIYLQIEKVCKNYPPLSFFVEKGYRVVYENTKILDIVDESNPYFIQATDLKTPFISKNNLFTVSKSEWLRYERGRIEEGELLIEVKGKAKKVAIVQSDFPMYSLVSGSLFKLTTNEKISSHTLLTYLLCKYGTFFKERYKSNLLISYISKPDLYRIPVPKFNKDFQDLIDNIFENIYSKNRNAERNYYDSEQLLLSELGMVDFVSSAEAISVKSLSECFLSSGRLDAEYYQPKYDRLFEILSHFDHDTLGNITDIKKSIEPGSDCYSDEGISFIRVSDITKYGISEPDIKLPFDVVSNVHSLYPKKDTILLSKDGSVGIAYKVEQDLEVVTSSALLHLTIKNQDRILPDYLTLMLNSFVVQLQAERDAGGSIIQHWKPSEIENVVIPILDKPIQKQIAEKIQQSFALRRQSERLLETAKQAVEMAIEQGESKAIAWLNEKGDE